jgi:hypothetical protein
MPKPHLPVANPIWLPEKETQTIRRPHLTGARLARAGVWPDLWFLHPVGFRLADMCFKITPAQREYFHYRDISAEFERRGYSASRPELAWAIRQKQHEPEETADDQNKVVNSSSPSTPDSN